MLLFLNFHYFFANVAVIMVKLHNVCLEVGFVSTVGPYGINIIHYNFKYTPIKYNLYFFGITKVLPIFIYTKSTLK